ncbi:MAG TPA: cytochrome b5-like heme/steroid binding domain-containing protein [Patescibacteria group bacterium]|nr:cytochrome b5-like heme/steroid binding domain-containing protein [Patescibacteria group bacterium]
MKRKYITWTLVSFWLFVVIIFILSLIFTGSVGNISTSNNGNSGTLMSVKLTAEEIIKHNVSSDCWLIINNKVYDVTSFLLSHPGGEGLITPFCGKEATRAFDTREGTGSHSGNAASLLTNYYIGNLNQTINLQSIKKQIKQSAKDQFVPRKGEDD